VRLTPWNDLPKADAIVAAVSHREFMAMEVGELTSKLLPQGVFVDVKAAFDSRALSALGLRVWRL